jgi:hypothetical protein
MKTFCIRLIQVLCEVTLKEIFTAQRGKIQTNGIFAQGYQRQSSSSLEDERASRGSNNCMRGVNTLEVEMEEQTHEKGDGKLCPDVLGH